MLGKKEYANGQKTYELKGNILTYFYKNGQTRAFGSYKNDLMEGKWTFYRENGQLWQIGNFKENRKHGQWLRYDKNNVLEYDNYFENGKLKK